MFTQHTLDFLFENKLHDSKEWFSQHKQEYTKYVTEPFREIVLELAPTMAKIDSLIICDPKKLSRIYLDARRSRGAVFRDEMWFTFSRPREDAYDGHPGYWLAISPRGMSCGCGYYSADGAIKEQLRQMILADDPAFAAAAQAVAGQRRFAQYGELYKRRRYPEASPEKADWLERREYGVGFYTDDRDFMFAPDLAKRLSRDFLRIAPLYDFLLKAKAQAEGLEESGRR